MLSGSIAVLLMLTAIPQAVPSQDKLLEFLIRQNEAAKDKIKTARYKVKWSSDLDVKEGRRHNEGSGEVATKGHWRLSIEEASASVPATGWSQQSTSRMVLNDKYFAYWPSVGNAYIYQNDHQSAKELSPDSQLRRDLLTTPDIYALGSAFGGGGGTTFREMMALHPDKITWTAEEAKRSNGDIVYLVKRYSPFMNDPAKPDGVWTIDPQKGFLVTEAVFYSKAGGVWVTRTMQAKDMGDGVWFPASYQERRYGKPTDPQPTQAPVSETTIRVEDVSINAEIPDDYFTVQSILPPEYREATTLFRKGLDGNTTAYVWMDGGYVPRQDKRSLDEAMEKSVQRIDEHGVAADEHAAARAEPSEAAAGNRASSGRQHVPPAAKADDSRLAYVLFGAAVLGLGIVIPLTIFGRRILKRSQR